MSDDPQHDSNLILLASRVDDPDALSEALCDARHQLRGLSVCQLLEISSFIDFVRMRDENFTIRKMLPGG